MYLSCPNCKAIFEASDSHFAKGKKWVRCSACLHEWQASKASEKTINKRLGEKQTSGGLGKILKKRDKDSFAEGSSKSGKKPSLKATLEASAKSFKPMSYEDEEYGERSGGSALPIVVVIFIGLVTAGAAAVVFRNDILTAFPDAQPIYEFVRSLYYVVETAVKEILQDNLPQGDLPQDNLPQDNLPQENSLRG